MLPGTKKNKKNKNDKKPKEVTLSEKQWLKKQINLKSFQTINLSVLGMTEKCIWWWGSNSGDLGSEEYPFITTTLSDKKKYSWIFGETNKYSGCKISFSSHQKQYHIYRNIISTEIEMKAFIIYLFDYLLFPIMIEKCPLRDFNPYLINWIENSADTLFISTVYKQKTVLILNWFVRNRTVYKYKNEFGIE